MSETRLAAIRVPGDGEPWAALGFIVADDTIGFANGAIIAVDAAISRSQRVFMTLRKVASPNATVKL